MISPSGSVVFRQPALARCWRLMGAVCLLFGVSSMLRAQTASVVEWNYGSATSSSSANVVNAGVATSPVTIQASTVSGFSASLTGTSPSFYSVVGTWSGTETSMLTGRTSVSPVAAAKVLYSTFTVKSPATGDWSSISVKLDYLRASTSPTNVRAYLTWNEGGAWKTRYSGSTSLGGGTGSWQTGFTLSINAGSTTPAATALAGTTFLLELQFFGSATSPNSISVDNVKLLVNSLANTDFGDHIYGTLAASTASQAASPDIRMGTNATDPEVTDGSNTGSTVDDLASTNDEDLTMPSFIVGSATTFSVPVTVVPANLTGSTARLGVFVDWNGDGDVLDANETATAQVVAASGSYTFSLTPPVGTTTGTKYLRLRITEGSTAPTFAGASLLEGEVEDYAITVNPSATTDFGDHLFGTLAASSASQNTSTDIRIGTNATDVETTDPSDANASADDASGTNDEDLTMPTFYVGSATTLSVPMTITAVNLTSTTARVNVFVDWNGDGDVVDASETQTVQTVGATGTYNFALTPPIGTTAGTKYLRIRATEGSTAPTFAGTSTLKGEVEDYAITVNALDYGDYSGFASASSTVISGLKIGTNLGADAGVTNATASGDDANGIDDEDGVAVPVMVRGQSASIPVTVTNLSGAVAYLNVWVDFNANGTLTDAGDQVATNLAIANNTTNGVQTVTFAVPLTAATNTPVGVRVRLTSTSSPGVSGSSGNGEVEDHISVIQPVCNPQYAYVGDSIDSSLGGGRIYRVDSYTGAFSPAGPFVTPNISPYGSSWVIEGIAGFNDTMVMCLSNNFANAGAILALFQKSTGIYQHSFVTNVGMFDIAVAKDGLHVFGVDGGNVRKYRLSDGALIATYALPSGGHWGCAVQPVTGDVFVTMGWNGGTVQVGRLDSNLASFNLISGTAPAISTHGYAGMIFVTPTDFCVMERNVQTPHETGDAKIRRFALTSVSSNTATLAATLQATAGDLPDGYDLSFAYDGRLIAASQDGSCLVGFNATTNAYNGVLVGAAAAPATAKTLFIDCQETMSPLGSIGNLVFRDLNNNGIKDAGDTGIDGVTVTLKYDANGDGDFLDVGESAYRSTTTLGGGLYSFGALDAGNYQVVISTPPASFPNASTVRVALDNQVDNDSNGIQATAGGAVTSPTIALASGEGDATIDFGFDARPITNDFSDFSGVASADSTMNSLLRLGATVDAEVQATLNVTATGDDVTGTDDEDGVTMPAAITQGASVTIPVSVFNNTGTSAYLNAWIDFNNDGVFNNALISAGGERLEAARTIASSASASSQSITFTVPATASAGIQRGVRFRLTNQATTAPTGTVGSGEVEDYIVSILTPVDQCTIQLGQWTLIGRTLVDVKSATMGRIIGARVTMNSPMTASIDGATTGTQYSLASQSSFYIGGATVVSSGSLYYGTTLDYSNGSLTFSGGGSAVNTNPPPFQTILDSVVTGSQALAMLAANSSATLSGTTITFTVGAGVGSGVAVFNYNAAFGNNTRTLNLNGQTPSAIVINTTATSLDAGGLPAGDWLTTKWLNRTVYNAPLATTGNFDKKVGSILAPYATINMAGAWVGSIGADTITINANNSEPRSLAVTCASPVGVGNLVWADANSNGVYDAGEGVDGVTVKLFNVGDATTGTPVATAVTSGGGKWLMSNLVSGYYFAHVASSNFQTGSPLWGTTSKTSTGLADNVDHGIDDASPAANGISSNAFTLAPDSQPTNTTGETGVGNTDDDADDDNANLTVDFGFSALPITKDYADWNGSGALAAATFSTVNATLRLGATVDAEATVTPDAGATADGADEDGVTLPASITAGTTVSFPISVFNNSGASAYLNAWIDFNNDGTFNDTVVSSGGERLEAVRTIASSASASTQTITFTVPAAASTGTLRGARFRLTNQATTTPTGGVGNGEVEDYVVTILPGMSIGNVVWNDVNNNGVKDAGESGIGGVTVQLFRSGADNIVNTADDVQVGSNFTTGVSGAYLFTNLVQGNYYVKVTPPASYPLTSGTPATTDNNADNTNDGAQPGGPGTALYSPIINLAANAESITDGDTDPNSNMTVDFGLFTGFTLGNLVFNDINNSGTQDAGELGLANFTVELLNSAGSSFSPAVTATTNSSGNFGFLVYSPGTYKVKVTPPVGTAYPLASTVVGIDNATDNNNDGLQPGGQGTPATSFVFTLTAGGEPGTSGTSNTENTIDFGFRACPTILVSGTLPSGTQDTSYATQTLTASGGTAPYVWTLQSGTLPTGLALTSGVTATTATITGTPTVVQSQIFTLRTTDALGCFQDTSYTVAIGCPTVAVTPATLGPFTQYQTIASVTMVATGGRQPYTWSATGLPAGLSLSSAGVLTGTPTDVPTSYAATISLTDGSGCAGSRNYSIVISCPTVSVANSSLPNGTVGTAYPSTTFAAATAGVSVPAQTYTWSVNPALPAGLTLSSAGVLSGTPTAAVATTSYTFTASNQQSCTGTKVISFSVGCPTITVSPSTLSNATVGAAYNQATAFSASGGTGPYTFGTPTNLPAGMSWDSVNLKLTGTPTTAGTNNIVVTATDARSCSGAVTIAFTVVCPTLTLAPTSLSAATVGSAYSQATAFSFSGLTGTGTWSASGVPSGMSFNTSTKKLTGTPTTAGLVNVTVTATDSTYASCSGNVVVPIRVCPVISISPSTLANGTVGTAYSQATAFTASGGSAPYTWGASGVPAGMSFDVATQKLIGTCTSAGTTTVTVTATDSLGCVGTSLVSFTAVCPTVSITPTTLSPGTVGSVYNQTTAFTASGGTAPYTYSASGLPIGMSFDAVNRKLTGTPTIADVYNVTIVATDVNSCSGSQVVTMSTCQAVTISPATLSNATIGAAYSRTMTASEPGFDIQQSSSSTALSTLANADAVLAGTNRTSSWTGSTSTVNFFGSGAGDGNFTGAAFPGGAGEDFALKATGVITIPTAGAWTFGTNSDDGVRVKIDGSNVINDDSLHANADRYGNVTLTAGTHTIELVFFERGGGEAVELFAAAGTYNSFNSNFKLIGGSGGLSVVRANTVFTWSLTSGALPTGLALNTTTGVIGGTPTGTPTTANFIIRAVDQDGCAGSQAMTLTTACPTVSFSPGTLATGTVGSAYSQTVLASGGNGTITYALSSGAMPAGLSFNTATGAITGTPTTSNGAGTSITITATDAYACVGSITYTLKICPVLSLSPAGPFSGTVGSAFSQTLTASNGASPYTWSIASGSLPAGLTLSTAGVISGVPTAAAVSTSVTVQATDANGCPGTRTLLISATCPVVGLTTASTLSLGTVGVPFSVALTATGGSSPYSLSLNSGSLPAGLSLSPAGVISGTPSAATSGSTGAAFNVGVADQYGCSGSKNYTLKVCPVITLSGSPPSGTTGSAYTATISASGSTALPYTFAIITGSLPNGLTMDSSGNITGTPLVSGSPTITVSATDTNGCVASASFSIPIGCPATAITPMTPPTGTVATAYGHTLTASGGTSPYTWSVLSGTMPAGLALSTDGVISGTPTAATSGVNGASISVQSLDANGCAASATITVKICPIITISPATLNVGTVGSSYSQAVTQSGGATPASWSIASGTLPSGLGLNGVSGLITGTPTASNGAGTSITARLSDANGCVQTKVYTLKVCPVLSMAPTTMPQGYVGSAYSQSITASGGASPYTFAVSGGTLPAGLTLSSAGLLSGTPTASNGAGATITFTATDSNGCSGTMTCNVQVCPTMSITPATMPAATVGTAYSQTFTTTGGASPYTYSLTSGALPTWATLNPSTGVISGMPNTTTTASFTITATDANNCAWPRSYTLTPACPTIAVTPTTINSVVVGTSYTQSTAFSATGLTGAYNWSATSVPAGMTFDATNKMLTGTPTTAGLYSVSVKATDGTYATCSGTSSVSFRVCPVITLTSTLTVPTVGVTYSATISSSGGASAYTYAVTSGSLPAGLSLSTAGVLSGKATSNASVTFVVTSTDANACTGSQSYTVKPNCPTITVTPTTLSNATVGSAYAQATAFSASSSGNTTFTYGASGIPAGMSFDTVNKKITGTPQAAGASSITMTATDANGCSGSVVVSLTAVCPTITLSPASLTPGYINAAYSGTITAAGGTASYAYSITAGALPGGLSMTTGGVISGTPTGVGTSSVTIRAVDSLGCAGSTVYSFEIRTMGIGNLVFNDTNNNGTFDAGETGLAGATVELFSPGADNVIGGTAANADTQVGAGITTTSTGVYSFSNLAPGNYFVKVTPPSTHQRSGGTAGTLDNRVDNDNNGAQSALGQPAYSPIINLADGAEPTTDGDADNKTDWTVDFGFWSGFTVGNMVWADANSDGIYQSSTESGVNGLTVAMMTRGVNNVAYDGDDAQVATTTTVNGVFSFATYTSGTYYFKVTPNSTYPVIAFNSVATDTGIDNDNNAVSQPGLINTVINGGVFTLAAGTEPGSSGTTNIDNTIDLAVRACPTITITPSTLATATVGAAYTQAVAFTSSGGVGVVTYAASGVPAGMTFDAVNRIITGTPTTAASSNITITATDAYGCTGSVVISFSRVCPTIAITPSTLPLVVAGSAYTQPTAFSASSIGNGTFAWSASNLPPGMSFDALNRMITGTPTTPGVYTFNVSAADGNACAGTGSVTIRVCPVLTLTSPALPSANVGLPYVQSSAFAAGNGTGPYSYSLSGLPNGLTFDSANAKIIGTPTTLGTSVQTVPLSLSVLDANGCPATFNVNLTVIPAMRAGGSMWVDANNNGIKDSGEVGVPGATVQLWQIGLNGVTNNGAGDDVKIGSDIVTDAAGNYVFTNVVPGSGYYVYMPTPVQNRGVAAANAVDADNDVDGDNNAIQLSGPGTAIRSPVFALSVEGEPGAVADGDDVNGNLTIDFGMQPSVCVGNLVFNDANNDGIYTSGTDQAMDGVFLQLFQQNDDPLSATPVQTTTSSGGGVYRFCVLPGNYFIFIPPTQFQLGGAAYGMKPTVGRTDTSVPDIDDNGDQNLLASSKPSALGASTGNFTLAIGTLPLNSTGESGFNKTSDDAYDADSNLTVDLGLYTITGVGAPLAGRVRRDLTGTGDVVAPATPLPNVEVTLFADTNANGVVDTNELAAVDTTVTDNTGAFTFDGVMSGSYIVEQAVLPGATATFDTDGGDPKCTAIAVDGAALSGIDFMQAIQASSFAQWQQQHPDAGVNADGDRTSSLLEYALGTSPDHGDAARFWLENGASGVDAVVLRPTAPHNDLRSRLQRSADLVTWTTLALAPAIEPNRDGTERVRFVDVAGTLAQGYIRVVFELDADLDGVPEDTVSTTSQCFHRSEFGIGQQTFSMPLTKPEAFAGKVMGVQDATLTIPSVPVPATPSYVEVINGGAAGHRFDLELAGCATGMLRINAASKRNTLASLSPSLEGSTVVVRPHWMLRDLLPVNRFHASTSGGTADRVLFYDAATKAYRIHWLAAMGTGPRWVVAGDVKMTDAGGTVVGPTDAVLVQPRAAQVSLMLLGEARTWNVALPLVQGSQLVGTGFAVPRSPLALGMNLSQSFAASADAASADRIQKWLGDATAGATGYQTFFLRDAANLGTYWSDESGGDASHANLLDAFRGAFLLSRDGNSSWVLPAP